MSHQLNQRLIPTLTDPEISVDTSDTTYEPKFTPTIMLKMHYSHTHPTNIRTECCQHSVALTSMDNCYR